jgi:P27 family predicted phage terminase small subunit
MKVPEHLSEASAAFCRRLRRKYRLHDHHDRLLIAACEAWDRMVQARELIAQEGLTTTDRHGQSRPHPAVAIERDSRTAFARMLRELALSDESPDENRPPRPSGRYAGRH